MANPIGPINSGTTASSPYIAISPYTVSTGSPWSTSTTVTSTGSIAEWPTIRVFDNIVVSFKSFLNDITTVRDENGMLICDELRTIFIYKEPSIIDMPKLRQPGYKMVDIGKNSPYATSFTVKDFVKIMNTVMIYCKDLAFGMPHRKYDSVGFDLHCLKDAVVEPGEFMDVETGVHCAFPSHIWGLLVSRSSIFKKRLIVNTGIIDPGFQGELFACVYNAGKEQFKIERGDRLAQLIPMQDVPMIGVQQAYGLDEFPATNRGTNGFGSTGK